MVWQRNPASVVQGTLPGAARQGSTSLGSGAIAAITLSHMYEKI